jgi:cytochrome c oxidase accessory protein FixG
VGGHPAVFFDIDHSNLFLFGAAYNSQDAWLLSFLLTAMGFGIVYVTALAGRVWCGWACPQTVFLDGVYRGIERLVEGSREVRLRRKRAGWTVERLARHIGAHTLYAAVSVGIACVVLTYFVSAPQAFAMIRRGFAANPRALAWVLIVAGVLYLNFSWFREQLCVVICPYGRLQSVLQDEDSLVVGFDARRGEPRGKKGQQGAGACIDCRRCVVVCPTGIDVRNGVQLECIACTACIDACDGVMAQLGRPHGLIRYDSQAGLTGRPRRIVRPRLLIYTALLVVGGVVAAVVAGRRMEFEATLLRLPGAPYAVEGGVVRNAMQVHLVNKRSMEERYLVDVEPRDAMGALVPLSEIAVPPLGDARAPIVLSVPVSAFRGDFQVRAHVTSESDRTRSVVVTAMFLGPTR